MKSRYESFYQLCNIFKSQEPLPHELIGYTLAEAIVGNARDNFESYYRAPKDFKGKERRRIFRALENLLESNETLSFTNKGIMTLRRDFKKIARKTEPAHGIVAINFAYDALACLYEEEPEAKMIFTILHDDMMFLGTGKPRKNCYKNNQYRRALEYDRFLDKLGNTLKGYGLHLQR